MTVSPQREGSADRKCEYEFATAPGSGREIRVADHGYIGGVRCEDRAVRRHLRLRLDRRSVWSDRDDRFTDQSLELARRDAQDVTEVG